MLCELAKKNGELTDFVFLLSQNKMKEQMLLLILLVASCWKSTTALGKERLSVKHDHCPVALHIVISSLAVCRKFETIDLGKQPATSLL